MCHSQTSSRASSLTVGPPRSTCPVAHLPLSVRAGQAGRTALYQGRDNQPEIRPPPLRSEAAHTCRYDRGSHRVCAAARDGATSDGKRNPSRNGA